MLDRVTAAFENQDYRQASQLLKQLYKQSPQDPQVQLYIGRLYEETHKIEAAEKAYRQLLRTASFPKILTQARLGLQRLEAQERASRNLALSQAASNPQSQEPGVLILEATPPEKRKETAQQLARILQIDPYTAKMRLQSYGWRLYRTGPIGELRVYGEELQQAGIPVFWASLDNIAQIKIFRVRYFQSFSGQPTVVCQNRDNRLGAIAFDWQEVTQRVEGGLPIFVDAVHYDISRKKSEQVKRKLETRDYARVCDLHLSDRNCILRLCDRSYEFQKDASHSGEPQTVEVGMSQTTNRLKWNGLLENLERHLSHAPVRSEFTPFGETVVEYSFMLARLSHYIELGRQKPSNWDPAFALYSGLVFLKHRQL
ncbi:tetratricopeptide repeat protein [Oscillatoriales cyanobacterium LEGE 11467]|uniref:Tetratricopeptide repeat protein n=1 Tax=Zarconia navalis LEGE 11467 TaxID=1828826 RepID=A0A928VYF0_9CYAN|nr:tetratricopeptide repeat protein [Zarconia navalis]MBE9040423.1 tetratricopeptide repeat protein [Zarconia navalis LEGE 11467]